MAPIKTVLATGGSGYIGSHCVLELLNAGYDVVAVDNFVNSTTDNNKAISLQRVEQLTGKTVIFYPIDITNKSQLDELFKKHKIDCVIHFAALKNVRESVEKPLEYYRNNLFGCLELLQVMKENNCKNLVFSSSATVYGRPKRLPVVEEDSPGPAMTNPYGQTKYMMEEILRDLCKAEKDWNVVILRYFNPVGAHRSGVIGEDPSGVPQNLMPYVAQVAVGRRPFVPVFGNDFDTPDGSGVRDFIHVVDLSEGHVAAMKKIEEGDIGLKTYNLGTGGGHSVLEMIAALEKAAGKKIPYEIHPRKDGDVPSVYCDASLAFKELGWKTKRGLEEMARDLWNWQSKNPHGYKES